MRLATLLLDGRETVCCVSSDGNCCWPATTLGGEPFAGMVDLIRRVSATPEAAPAATPAGAAIPLDPAMLRAPLVPGRNIMCVGKNYGDHVREFAQSGFDSSGGKGADAIPDAPIIFTKAPETVIGPGEPIRIPRGLSDQVDYEAELAVVIGKGGRGIAREQAMEHVFGYTIVNDVTARDLQLKHRQWFLGKSIDGFCPMGPWIVTADELDASNIAIQCRINGELRQDARTADLIFDIPALIACISAGMALKPGDVIATGTPAGVGAGFTPPRFLAPGDLVSIEIEGIGRLENPVA
jgi:2-keto-4-pentenoate hydratase/2-oxohepta-3-ene-1,7-dioic acid hydratase in catechol pathway